MWLPSLKDWFMKNRLNREAYLMAPCIGCALFIFLTAFIFLYTLASAWGWVVLFAGFLYCWMVYEAWRGELF